jgi:hypothetical protein
MRRLALHVALIGCLCCIYANADNAPLSAGTVPNDSVESWIKYAPAGPINSPPPVLFVAPRKFKLEGFGEELLVLTGARYSIVERFTMNAMAKNDCSVTTEKRNKENSVEIFERADGKIVMCVLERASACAYFVALDNLKEARWAPVDRKLLVQFEHSIGIHIDGSADCR